LERDQLIRIIKETILTELKDREGNHPEPQEDDLVPVGVSVRHVHLSQADLDVLYGPGYKLTKRRDLYQPGEFATDEVLALVGPKMRAIENVRVLGPLRGKSQVEVSRTDAIHLGINPPVRRSGDLKGSASLTLVGPRGSLFLKESVICANRHIHMDPVDARRLGLADDDQVKVAVFGEKALIFDNVQVRVKETFKLEMHLDTDDANAAGIKNGDKVRIIRPELEIHFHRLLGSQ
jgi:putative phosphotransacetylase